MLQRVKLAISPNWDSRITVWADTGILTRGTIKPSRLLFMLHKGHSSTSPDVLITVVSPVKTTYMCCVANDWLPAAYAGSGSRVKGKNSATR
jgi:hypothetical protein